MNEELELYLEDANEKMQSTIDHLDKVLSKIRAGRANPAILDGLMIDYYGTPTPLSRISTINTPDARTIRIQPFERNMVAVIDKAVLTSNLGFNPTNNGEVVIINVPPLTEERRRDLVKQAKNEGENAKISIRNIRRDINEEVKKLQKQGVSEDLVKDSEENIQKLTTKFIAKIDEQIAQKEKDILTI
jgi:ribosome recycling factor